LINEIFVTVNWVQRSFCTFERELHSCSLKKVVKKKDMFVKKNREKKNTRLLEKIVRKKIIFILFMKLMTLVCEYLFISRVRQFFFLRWFLIALIFLRVDVKCIKSFSHRRHNKREVSSVVRAHSIKCCQFSLVRLIFFYLMWRSLFSIVKLTFLISYEVKYHHCLNFFEFCSFHFYSSSSSIIK
jgi:hypothetical protein